MQRSSKNMDVSKNKIEIRNLCNDEISKILSPGALFGRSFKIAELSGRLKNHVHIRAYTDFYGGYAEHGRNVVLRLGMDPNFEVKLTPIKSLIDIDPITFNKLKWYINNPNFEIDKSKFLGIAGPGWFQEPFLPETRYKIGWTMIESFDCLPEMGNWLRNLNELWAPTTTDYIRFQRLNLDIPIHIVRLGCDTNNIFSEQKINIKSLQGRYVFGFVGSWNKRKGIKQIIRAFCKAFKSKDNVSLLLISKYGTRPYDGIKDGERVSKDDIEKWDIKYEFERYTKDFDDKPHISIIDVPIHDSIMPSIYSMIDCLVGFSMGESTWLPGLEAGLRNIPIIQLDSPCSGFKDYLNDSNSTLCKDYQLVIADNELVLGTSEYYKGQMFAQGNEDELAHIFNITKGLRRNEQTQNLYQTVCEEWSWDKSIERVKERLNARV